MSSELSGRTAIITGAASGIGRAIAVRYAQAGARVVVVDRTRSPWHGGTATDELITDAVYLPCDLAVTGEVERVVPEVVERFGAIDIVVNNAATSASKPLVKTTNEDWHQVLAVNITAAFTLSRAAVQQMLRQVPRGEVRGRIINITSQHGMVAAPEDTAYGVSKAALAQLTRQVSAEYAPQGIVCNAIAPGKIDTGPSARAKDEHWQAYWKSRTPWPRLGRPEDVAAAALFLASDDASYLTGVNLMVDGGWMAN